MGEERNTKMTIDKMVCLDESGLYIQALEICNEHLQNSPNDYLVLMIRARVEEHAGLNQDAIRHLSELIACNPYDVFSLYQRGCIREREEAFDEAMADYDACIARMPDCAPAYLNRGLLWQRRGAANKAHADFERVVEVESQSDEKACTPLAYFFMGEHAKAKTLIQEVVNLNDKTSCYQAACVYALLDEKEQALKLLQQAVNLGFRHFNMLKQDRFLSSIKNLPAFQQLEKLDQ